MGGLIGMTLRLEDGSEHRMSRHTNWTPYAIDNIELANKNPLYIESVLVQPWKEALDKKEEDRHWTYGSPFLAPADYGLVVVDLLKNKILECNGYHMFGAFNVAGIGLDLPVQIPPEITDVSTLYLAEPDSDAYRFYQFYKENRIKEFSYANPERRVAMIDEPISDINDWPLKKITDFILSKKSRLGHFVIDMSPFEVIRFKESPQGFQEFRQAVLDLGFLLSEEEEEMWQEFTKEEEEEEDS